MVQRFGWARKFAAHVGLEENQMGWDLLALRHKGIFKASRDFQVLVPTSPDCESTVRGVPHAKVTEFVSFINTTGGFHVGVARVQGE